MFIEFYELDLSAFCRSVKLIARLINVPLKSKVIDLFNHEQFKPEFVEKTPFHKVPFINDDGFYLSESRAIATYLVDKYSPDNDLYPKDIRKRAIIDQMLYYDSGTVAPAIVALLYRIFYDKQLPEPDMTRNAKDVFKTLDSFLSQHDYVAGECLTVADICIRESLTINEILNKYGVDISEFKNLALWANRITRETDPAYSEIHDEPIARFREITKNKVTELKLEGN